MASVAPKSGEFVDGKFWFTRKGSLVTVGLTNLGLEEVGSVESLELPLEGDDFVKGDIIATLQGSNGQLEVVTPASGIIQEINDAARQEPDRVSEDPLEEGWLVKLEIQDFSDLKEYGSHE